jgi:hypothetical protein
VWNKGAAGVLGATEDVGKALPFALLDFDCDNGREFLNRHLWTCLAPRKSPVEFTRSPPYPKDDNAHVEQKNWTWARQLLGYGRWEQASVVVAISALYKEVWGPLQNFYLPGFKLKEKWRSARPGENSACFQRRGSPQNQPHPFDRRGARAEAQSSPPCSI